MHRNTLSRKIAEYRPRGGPERPAVTAPPAPLTPLFGLTRISSRAAEC